MQPGSLARFTFTALSTLAAVLPAASAIAQQQWPQRPVRIIVPFPAGGSTMESVVRQLTRDMSIVNVSSCYAVTGRKGMPLYDASKAGLVALTRTLAHEEAAHGIRANAILPGSTYTDFHRMRGLRRDARSDNSLLGRWARPEEIAFPILWLASDEASFITGETLLVDGGLAIL